MKSRQSRERAACAPGVEWNEGSCIREPVLRDMAIALDIRPDQPKATLVREFESKLSNACGADQSCWTTQPFVSRMNADSRRELTKYTFRAVGPALSNEWLSTIHINDIMNQYERLHSEFKFFGALPVDFESLPEHKLHDIDFAALEASGKYKFAAVINLDRHDQDGSHWVALYCNLRKRQVYFFDSYGVRPPALIAAFIEKICKYFGDECDSRHNTTRHQFASTECGVYSINFILRMLRHGTFEEIESTPMPDKKIQKCRRVYFRVDMK